MTSVGTIVRAASLTVSPKTLLMSYQPLYIPRLLEDTEAIQCRILPLDISAETTFSLFRHGERV
ncbi:hypothetical protein BZY95_15775 [Billgrantia desiderata SP1]|nr:hypothetical protein BZY95_15775 [Halomonas desiderata SP1]